MLTFLEFVLLESQEINLSKKILKNLSQEAKQAIYEWESVGWVGGLLERHFASNSQVAKEILDAFEPVKQYLKSKYSSGITLYRGMQKKYYSKQTRVLESWTSDKKVAEHFAGLRKANTWESLLYDEIKDSDIKKVLAQYQKYGMAAFGNKKFIRNKDMPEYYDIYSSSGEYITDGDDLELHLKNEQEYIRDINKEKLDNAIIITKKIKIDDIVWITNELNSKEFIVKAR